MGGEGVFIPSQWPKVMTQKGRYLIGEVRGTSPALEGAHVYIWKLMIFDSILTGSNNLKKDHINASPMHT